MVLLSAHGLAPCQIAELLECHPATVRRWIGRFNDEGLAGLADRPRSGWPALGRPGPWTLRVPTIHPCWSGSMLVFVKEATEPVSSADIHVRDPLRVDQVR
jgi:Winged helix-turn helix